MFPVERVKIKRGLAISSDGESNVEQQQQLSTESTSIVTFRKVQRSGTRIRKMRLQSFCGSGQVLCFRLIPSPYLLPDEIERDN